MARLRAWVADHAAEAIVASHERDADRPVAHRANELVKAFIIEKGLILYGGQAIDYALRLKGSGIYSEEQMPDYDVYSPTSVHHAYELADRLHAAGFKDVGAIRAIHVTTMRVRTDFIYVADITYAPPSVFGSLPVLSYAGMSVIHPDYQRTDMHQGFCYPYNSPPREDVCHRFAKDLARLRLLDEFYPITEGAILAAGGGEPPRVEAVVELDRVALHGFAAYGLLRGALEELRAGMASPPPPPEEAPLLGVTLALTGGARREARVAFAPPGGEPALIVASPWPAEVAARGGGGVTRHAPYMDVRPPLWRVPAGKDGGPVTVYAYPGRLLAVAGLAGGDVRAQVVNPQYLLLYFLLEAHVAGPGVWRDTCVAYYRATRAVLGAADALLGRLAPPVEAPEDQRRAFRRLVAASPFGLSVRTLGDVNQGAAFLQNLARWAKECGDPVPLGVDYPDMIPTQGELPRNYYPGRLPPPSFSYAQSPPFRLGGEAE